MRRSRRIAVGGLGLAAALVALEARYYRGASALCHPARKHVTAEVRRATLARLPTLEDVSFTTSDGLTLRGFYVPAKNGATVVMGHGLGDNRMHMLPGVEMLARHGYGALFFDWRAHGESDGDVSTWSDREQLDFSAAIDFAARRPDVTGGRIAGLGFSIGASTVALVAARDTRVRAVILEAVYPSFEQEVRDKMGTRGILSLWPARLAMRRAGIDADHIRPIDHIAEIHPRPILEIAGTLDTDTSVRVATAVFERAAEPKRLWVVEGAAHGEYETVAPVEFERVMTAFLDDALFPARGL